MRFQISAVTFAAAAFVLTAAPALAQGEPRLPFAGLYVGGSFGGALQPSDDPSRILFDRNLDGAFGDTIVTAAGADAFSPGFCGGRAKGSTPAASCRNDKDGIEYYGRVGFDVQRGALVLGAVGEFGKPEIDDSVSAFSTTPASYTMTRKLRYTASVRGRVGFAARTTLFYATGGGAYGRVRNSFSTTNVVNAFAPDGSHNAYGYAVGGGIEQKIGEHFSFGLEYLFTDLKDNDARVAVTRGTAGATNPFILGNANGTVFARSDPRFRWNSMRVTAAFRF